MAWLSRRLLVCSRTILPALALSLAILVLCGWWFKRPTLVQLTPRLAPMQFNTTLCFVALSLGVLGARTCQWRGLATVWASLSLGLAAVSTLQYPQQADFGIDTFFVEPFVTTRTSPPGRMAPNPGVAFICSALALLLCLTAQHVWSLLIAGAMAFGSAALALSGLLGYVLQLKTVYDWSDITRMALHTALLHTVLALSGLGSVNARLWELIQSRYLFQTMGFFGVGVVISGLLSLAAHSADSKQIYASLRREALIRRAAIQDVIDSDMKLLHATGRFFVSSDFVRRDEFRAFVTPFLAQDSSIVAFDWAPRIGHQERPVLEQELQAFMGTGIRTLGVDRTLLPHAGADVYYPVQYVAPDTSQQPVLGFDHYSDPLRAVLMDEAARTGAPQSTDLLRLFRLDGATGSQQGFLVFVPAYVDGQRTHTIASATDSRVRGFMVGVLRLSQVIRNALADFPQGEFHIAVYANAPQSGILQAQPAVFLDAKLGERAPVAPRAHVVENIQIANNHLQIELWPTKSFLTRQRSFHLSLITIVSLASAPLGANYFYFLQRKQTELNEREFRLRLAIDRAGLGTWDWNLHTGMTSF